MGTPKFDEDTFIRGVVNNAEFGGKPPRHTNDVGQVTIKTPIKHFGDDTSHGYPVTKVPGSIHAYVKPEHHLPVQRAQFRSYAHNPRWAGVTNLQQALQTWAVDSTNHVNMAREQFPAAMNQPLSTLFKPYARFEKQQSYEPWIGVDLDGTLAKHYGWNGKEFIGKPVPGMVQRIHRWLNEGKAVKILTARVSMDKDNKARRAIQKWCKEHLGVVLPVTNRKDHAMVRLWDDRAMKVEKNTGLSTIQKAAASVDRQLKREAKKVNANPTEPQKDAGNYKMGHVRMHGMDISIENPNGSYRRGVSDKGVAWESKMHGHYGYIRGTRGRDKDHLDVFIGPNTKSELICVVDQVNPSTGEFDEHKCVLGCDSKQDARDLYLKNYDRGWQGFKAVTSLTKEQFRDWISRGTRMKPLAETAPTFDKAAEIVAAVKTHGTKKKGTCPSCGQAFKKDEPYSDVKNCEVCERFGPPREKKAGVEDPAKEEERKKKLKWLSTLAFLGALGYGGYKAAPWVSDQFQNLSGAKSAPPPPAPAGSSAPAGVSEEALVPALPTEEPDPEVQAEESAGAQEDSAMMPTTETGEPIVPPGPALRPEYEEVVRRHSAETGMPLAEARDLFSRLSPETQEFYHTQWTQPQQELTGWRKGLSQTFRYGLPTALMTPTAIATARAAKAAPGVLGKVRAAGGALAPVGGNMLTGMAGAGLAGAAHRGLTKLLPENMAPGASNELGAGAAAYAGWGAGNQLGAQALRLLPGMAGTAAPMSLSGLNAVGGRVAGPAWLANLGVGALNHMWSNPETGNWEPRQAIYNAEANAERTIANAASGYSPKSVAQNTLFGVMHPGPTLGTLISGGLRAPLDAAMTRSNLAVVNQRNRALAEKAYGQYKGGKQTYPQYQGQVSSLAKKTYSLPGIMPWSGATNRWKADRWADRMTQPEIGALNGTAAVAARSFSGLPH